MVPNSAKNSPLYHVYTLGPGLCFLCLPHLASVNKTLTLISCAVVQGHRQLPMKRHTFTSRHPQREAGNNPKPRRAMDGSLETRHKPSISTSSNRCLFKELLNVIFHFCGSSTIPPRTTSFVSVHLQDPPKVAFNLPHPKQRKRLLYQDKNSLKSL